MPSLPKDIPCYVTARNHVRYVRQMVNALRSVHAFRVIIIDNDSDYGPMVDYLKSVDTEVIYLRKNYGQRAAWAANCIDMSGPYYAVTDPDLCIDDVPLDFPRRLIYGLICYPNVNKVGLSLDINDLPNTPIGNRARRWEAKYWTHRADNPDYWHADTATTLAMYRSGEAMQLYKPALRTDRPYTAKHLPWYLTKEMADDCDRYYLKTLDYQRSLSWAPLQAKYYGD